MVDEVGDLPEIEVVGGDAEIDRGDSSEVEVGSDRPSWNPLIVVIVVVALMAVVAMVATSGDADDERADTEPTTPDIAATEPSATTSPRVESVSSDGFLLDEPRPVFGSVIGASLLFGSVIDGWKLLDLDTGLLRSVRALEGRDPIMFLPVAGGVVMAEPSASSGFVSLQFLPLPARSSALLPTVPKVLSIESSDPVFSRFFNVAGILHAGSSRDTFWMLTRSQSSEGRSDLQATLLDTSGQVLVGPFDIEARPRAATERGLIFDAGGHSFYVTEDGVRDLGPGRTYAAASNTVGRITCDAEAECRPQILDVESGESRTGDPLRLIDVSTDRVTMALSDEGELITVNRVFDPSQPADRIAPQTQLYFTLPSGSQTNSPISRLRTAPIWLPNDGGAVAITGIGLSRFTVTVGAISEDHRIAGLRVGSASALFVIPDE